MTPFATKDLLVTSLQEGILGQEGCDPTETCTNRPNTECPCGDECNANNDTNTNHVHEDRLDYEAALEVLRLELEEALV